MLLVSLKAIKFLSAYLSGADEDEENRVQNSEEGQKEKSMSNENMEEDEREEENTVTDDNAEKEVDEAGKGNEEDSNDGDKKEGRGIKENCLEQGESEEDKIDRAGNDAVETKDASGSNKHSEPTPECLPLITWEEVILENERIVSSLISNHQGPLHLLTS